MYGRDDLFPGSDHFLDVRDIIVLNLCMLRTDSNTFFTEDTLFFYDLCLLVCYLDRLYRTVTNALITVFTIGSTKLQD